MLFTACSLTFPGFTNLTFYTPLVRLFYFSFYLVALLKLYSALDEITLLGNIYTSTGFTPFLMLQGVETVLKVCGACAAGTGAVVGGYIVLAGDYSGVPDSTRFVHKHTPVRSIIEYYQGRISYDQMRYESLNPHEVAAKKAAAANAAIEAAKKSPG